MRIFCRKTLRKFWEDHEDIEQSLRTWYTDVKKSKWEKSNDIKEKYPKASFLKNKRRSVGKERADTRKSCVKCMRKMRGWMNNL